MIFGRATNTILLWLVIFQLSACDGTQAFYSAAKRSGKVLVVGATGSTGFRALQGLLDVGYKPNQIRLLTRDEHSSKSTKLKKIGFEIVQADLEDLPALLEKQIAKGCSSCYIHSTSSDTPELDKGEVMRARNLACAIKGGDCDICHIVYNSAAAHEGHDVKRIQQKHDVEGVFQKIIHECNDVPSVERASKLSFTSLRANIFMEELWKIYTRPKILEGVYPLPVRGSRKVYLVSVRDMGRLAGRIFQRGNEAQRIEGRSRIINVAGDHLSAREIASAFESVQGTNCCHHNPRLMTFKSFFFFPELYEQIRFLQSFSVVTDIERLKEEFPKTMTSFEEFLEETSWGDREKSFADFSDTSLLLEV